MKAREVYAKMAAGLDRNRKVRKGGRDARDVYLWVLRRVAERGATDGRIPAEDVQDAEFLADELMCSTEQARRGLERALSVRLLAIADGQCVVVGWDDEWARKPLTGAERIAKHRAKGGANEVDQAGNDNVTRESLQVTDENRCNTGEEIKERKGEEGDRDLGGLFGDQTEPVKPTEPDAVDRLWAEQERLRADTIPGSRPLKLTADRRRMVRGRLDDGHSEDDLRECLLVYAREAKSNGGEWFNGETNWRPGNVSRTLGRVGAGSSKPDVGESAGRNYF